MIAKDNGGGGGGGTIVGLKLKIYSIHLNFQFTLTFLWIFCQPRSQDLTEASVYHR